MRNIPLARPEIDEEEVAEVRRVLLSGWVTQGPEVRALEEEFAAFVDAPHAIAVSSGTAALELALYVLGIGPGDEVVTVSHSFIATASAIRRHGATPVFVDIDPKTFNIDPDLVEAAIGPRTKAMLVVHQIGMPCDLQRLIPIAARHGMPLVEDAACASGSEILWQGDWQKIGRPHGIIACFSFHPRKVLTTGDGGMVTTADAELAARMRRLRVHGQDIDGDVRHRAGVLFEQYLEPGFNVRLTDIQAAVGRVQLRKLPALVARRRQLAARYRQELPEKVPGLGLPFEPAWARSNYQSFCVRLPQDIEQVRAMQQLASLGISTRRGVMCAHREPAYPVGTWRGPGVLAQSEAAHDRTLLIPLFSSMTEAEQDCVIEALAAECRV